MSRLKVLALTQYDRMPNWDLFYQELGRHVDLDFKKLNKKQQVNLKKYFKSIDVSSYDRIFLELRFKQQLRQRHFLGGLPNLVEYETDANQNYKKGGKYEGAWSKYYSSLTSLRVISTGFNVSNRLRREGFDARFVPKGYNESEIKCLNKKRDIEVGFIGRVEKAAYDKRKEFLDECVEKLGLKLIRTEPGEAYNKMLNRIRFFVSADHGLGEYMIKNYEAMAAGCVLCCYRQGNGEEEALGLRDMENVVLYGDASELQEKLAIVRADKSLEDAIAKSGRQLAENNFGLSCLAEKVSEELIEPVIKTREQSLSERLLAYIGK
ncbi:MAG: glycosyltransferase [Candidatus Pelagadaptatus aseana]|uniref:glycosyltransferase family protein n=1 Tax=Candidatus Pelagadaptatus aseana TaxID=3120508 RepID=UPI0039B285C7